MPASQCTFEERRGEARRKKSDIYSRRSMERHVQNLQLSKIITEETVTWIKSKKLPLTKCTDQEPNTDKRLWLWSDQ